MLHILLAENIEQIYMNIFHLNYLNKRESVPASPSKFFEHTCLKRIIFPGIFIAILLRVGSPNCSTFQNNAAYYLASLVYSVNTINPKRCRCNSETSTNVTCHCNFYPTFL